MPSHAKRDGAEHDQAIPGGVGGFEAADPTRDGTIDHDPTLVRRQRRRTRRESRIALAHRIEQRLAVPVIAAAVISVPATFLTTADGWLGVAGKVFHWTTAIVLMSEPVLLFVLTGDRLTWLRQHLWGILIAVVAVPAVLFAVAAPYVQALRLLRLAHVLTAFRLLRINRILKAIETLRRYLLVDLFWRRLSSVIGPIVAFGFAGLVLADPDYRSLLLLDAASERFGPVPVVSIVALVAVSLAVSVRTLQRVLSVQIRCWTPRIRALINRELADRGLINS